MTRDEAAERDTLAAAQAAREPHTAEPRAGLEEFETAIGALLADADDDNALTKESNAVLDLIRAGKLDEAETAARTLLRHTDIHDGWDRLGMVYEARGHRREAADCYRRVIAIFDQTPDDTDPAFRASFVERIARLDPDGAP